MADRPIEAGWPDIVNSTGQPGTGTRINKELFDQILADLKTSLYSSSLDEGPPEIAVEVTDARGGYGTLTERLAALEALASGGQSATGIAPSVNLVPNGNFLIWGKGKAVVPSYWTNDGALTIAWQTAQGDPSAALFPGPFYMRLTSPDATDRDVYNDLVTVADLTTFGGIRLTGQRFSAGLAVNSGTTGAIELIVDDGTTEHLVASNTGVAGWEWINGTVELAATPTRLRLIVRMKAALSVDVAGAMLSPGDDGAAYYVPPLTSLRNMVAVLSGVLTDGVKVAFKPAQPMLVTSGYATAQAAGTGDILVKNAALDIFTTGLNFTGGLDTPVENAVGVAEASIDPDTNFVLEVDNADSNLAQVTVRLKVLGFVDVWPGLFAGRVVIP